MKIIVPMAGIGSRLRPHTLTNPKPLTLIAGKPIVQRLVEDIVKVVDQKVEEISFTIGPNVSLGDDSVVENSHIVDSLIQTSTTIKNANLKEAMIGNNAYFDGEFKSISIGDYSVLK